MEVRGTVMTTTNETANHVAFQPQLEPDSVALSPANLRRLHRLHSRTELAQEMAQQTTAALQEALLGIFEDAGVETGPQDRFHVDWRASTLRLIRPEEG